jgi:RNA polymerase sigma factor (sigma-70 family)
VSAKQSRRNTSPHVRNLTGSEAQRLDFAACSVCGALHSRTSFFTMRRVTPQRSRDVFADGSDEDLLEGWRRGSPQAGELLFDRHYETVRRYFCNKVSAAAAHDLVQETFLACVETHTRLRFYSAFRPYLLGIAHHVLVDHLRAVARQAGHGVDLDELVLADLQPGGDEVIMAKREQRLLLRALRRLDLRQQIALELHFFEAMTGQEIAEVLAEPLGTIRSRLRTGRLALDAQVARLAGSPEELRSTIDSLERWASRIRRMALPGEDDQAS